MSSIKLVSAVLIVAVMSGCASSVKREGSMSPHAAAVTKFSSANVTMTPEAQKNLPTISSSVRPNLRRR